MTPTTTATGTPTPTPTAGAAASVSITIAGHPIEFASVDAAMPTLRELAANLKAKMTADAQARYELGRALVAVRKAMTGNGPWGAFLSRLAREAGVSVRSLQCAFTVASRLDETVRKPDGIVRGEPEHFAQRAARNGSDVFGSDGVSPSVVRDEPEHFAQRAARNGCQVFGSGVGSDGLPLVVNGQVREGTGISEMYRAAGVWTGDAEPEIDWAAFETPSEDDPEEVIEARAAAKARGLTLAQYMAEGDDVEIEPSALHGEESTDLKPGPCHGETATDLKPGPCHGETATEPGPCHERRASALTGEQIGMADLYREIEERFVAVGVYDAATLTAGQRDAIDIATAEYVERVKVIVGT